MSILNTRILSLLTVLVFSLTALTAQAASVSGNWKRPDGSTVKVWKCGAARTLLCAHSGSTRMFDGIAPFQGRTNMWSGNMKHPDMPGFITFNGTALFTGKTIKIQGCMLGNSMCQSETWKK